MFNKKPNLKTLCGVQHSIFIRFVGVNGTELYYGKCGIKCVLFVLKSVNIP